MNVETVNDSDLARIDKFQDYHVIPVGHPLAHLNDKPLDEALAEIMQGVEFTRVFATHVRIKLEPILSIDFSKVNPNEITSVVLDIAKTIGVDKMTPKFLKDPNDDASNMLRTIDKKFAAANMPLNLEGIFSMSDDQRGFMLEFIRFWGMYYNDLPQQKLSQ